MKIILELCFYLRLFDREKKATYEFDLWAEDNGAYNRRKTRTTIRVIIEDVNDNAPQFQNQPYTYNLPEGTAPNHYVFKAIARDLDNAQISFSIQGNSEYFRIENNGDMYTRKTLTSGARGYHYLKVIANDGGTPSPLQTTGTDVSVFICLIYVIS